MSSSRRHPLLIVALLLGACGSPNNPLDPFDRVAVNVAAGGDGSGVVFASDAAVAIDCRITNGASAATGCTTRFPDAGGGGFFTLGAAEAEDSEFVGWSGCSSTDRLACTLQFRAGESPTFNVTATFRKRGSAGVAGYNENLLRNAGFEELVAIGSLPSGAGFWQGDETNSVVPPAGISLVEGARVLQFLTTGPAAASATGESSQLWQLVDVSSLATDIDAGKVRATAKARFASVPGDAQTDRRFDLRVGAFSGRPSDFPAAYLAPAGVRLADPTVSVITANSGAWLPAELTFILPPGTRYLAVEIYAFENVFNDATAPEFDGHFADETSLILRRVPCGPEQPVRRVDPRSRFR
ncbi:MAG: hypothetical protein U5K74_11980 [Gemmatimonadaceae bacterium]|nr:hypothetical protein [Gemmatimonadaceae bacterium]